MARNQTKYGSIARMNGPVQKFAFDNGQTIGDLLAVAKITLKKGETVTLDGSKVSTDYVFENGEEFIVMPSTSGA